MDDTFSFQHLTTHLDVVNSARCQLAEASGEMSVPCECDHISLRFAQNDSCENHSIEVFLNFKYF